MDISFERTDNKEDWITPKNILDELGHFDLDPCSSHYNKNKYADNEFFIEDDGLKKEWFGRVWCNPPYGTKTKHFIKKLQQHGNGIALVFARVDTKLWHELIFRYADAIFILKGRLKFFKKDGTQGDSAGAGSALIAFGKNNAEILYNTSFQGHFIRSGIMEINQQD